MPQGEIGGNHFGFRRGVRHAPLTLANPSNRKAIIRATNREVIPGGRTLRVDTTSEVGISV
eukprot:7179521-Heterocapsa_arctica.AAC.1